MAPSSSRTGEQNKGFSGEWITLETSAKILVDCRRKQPDHHLTVEGLGQESDCSASLRPRPHTRVGKSCDENDGNSAAGVAQPVLQIETVHARHLNVGNDARRLYQVR